MNKRSVARVLVVDDDSDEAELISLAFKISGFPVEVIMASTSTEAISRLIAPDRLPYNLVLLNLDSDTATGTDVLCHLGDHAYGCYAPKVALTSIVDPEALQKWYQLGATSVLRKPQDFDGFAAMVAELCAYWFRMNLLPKPA